MTGGHGHEQATTVSPKKTNTMASAPPPILTSRDTLDTLTLDHNESPLNFSPARKWTCTIIVVFMTATIAFCSSIHTAAISSIAKDLNCSRTVATLGVSTFLLGFASGPLIFAPLSEVYGRNPVYRTTLALFVLFNLGCALSHNIAALLVFRFLCGFFGSPTVTNSGGLVDRLMATKPSLCPSCTIHCCELLGSTASPYINRIYGHHVKKLGGPKPEARLPHLIFLSWLIPVGLFWFAWTANAHWASCIVSGIPFGIGFVTLFLGITSYLIDCYGKYAASALAANAILRSLFGAVFPLFSYEMYTKMGVAWATSVLGFVAVAMAPLPYIFYRFGPHIRGRSTFHRRTIEEEKGSTVETKS
ncbi:cellular nucleic acid-binding protein [Apiospora arundinis]